MDTAAWKGSYAYLQEDAQRMSADCAHFSMEEPDFSQLQAVADDIEDTKVQHRITSLTVSNIAVYALHLGKKKCHMHCSVLLVFLEM